MAISQANLPEGTNSIISDGADGSSFAGTDTGSDGGEKLGSAEIRNDVADKLGDAAGKVTDATASLRDQATEKAFSLASQGKERAVGVLDNVTKLVEDAASQIDEKAGEQYGAYARQASQFIAGFADTLRDKDVEELFDDTRALVRKSPAIAIGAAAALGFAAARLLKVGLAEPAADVAPKTADKNAGQRTMPTPSTATTVPVDTTF